MVYLAASMNYRDHATYLLEWVEFHRLVGFQRFFLYDNGSEDNHLEVLAPYIEEGIVIVTRWPGLGRQTAAINHCLQTRRDEARWIAFIDVDEFLFNPRGRPLPEILREYEDYPAVGVNMAIFGTSGHVKRPDGLVIENYLYRSMNPHNTLVKNVVQPARTKRALITHYFEFESGHAVDVGRRPLEGDNTQSYIQCRLRINHYYSKSLDELRAKYAKPRADNGELRAQWELEHTLAAEPNHKRDETILRYLPALKRNLLRLPA